MTSFIIFQVLVPLLAALLLILNLFFSKYSPLSSHASQKGETKAKITPFECGFRGLSQTRKPMKFVHNLVAVLFLIFDLELILIAPYAIFSQTLGNFALWIFILFTCFLALGFIYEYYSNAINLLSHHD